MQLLRLTGGAGFSPQRRLEPPAARGLKSPLQAKARSTRDLVLGILRIYKRWISPLLPSACRFHPTCSEYMLEAIERHGVWRGTRMGALRLLRCHPFHQGGFDPVR